MLAIHIYNSSPLITASNSLTSLYLSWRSIICHLLIVASTLLSPPTISCHICFDVTIASSGREPPPTTYSMLLESKNLWSVFRNKQMVVFYLLEKKNQSKQWSTSMTLYFGIYHSLLFDCLSVPSHLPIVIMISLYPWTWTAAYTWLLGPYIS